MKNPSTLIEVLTFFSDENRCIQYLSQKRWPNGIVCQRCGCTGRINYIKARKVYWCGDCKGQFSVRKNTIFEESRLPLQKWFAAIWLMTSHKKGISGNQLAKDIGITQKSAWFMHGRICEAMRDLGGAGKMFGVVEVDETYHGGKDKNKHNNKKEKRGRGPVSKTPIVGMVERGGSLKALKVKTVDGNTVSAVIREHICAGSMLMTDEHRAYNALNGSEYFRESVNHSAGEYVRGANHTNTIESSWALFKRGVYGIYHHVSEKHLQRYLDEFIARYNTRNHDEGERFGNFMVATIGKRLTYKELIA